MRCRRRWRELLLYEDDVISAVCGLLEDRGWEIQTTATAYQHGDDIHARRGDEHLLVEAKGAGSSKEHTKRYGNPFNKGQVRDHVAMAVHRALDYVSRGEVRAGIAIPDNDDHREETVKVRAALHRLGVAIFWVDDEQTVEVDAPWEV